MPQFPNLTEAEPPSLLSPSPPFRFYLRDRVGRTRRHFFAPFATLVGTISACKEDPAEDCWQSDPPSVLRRPQCVLVETSVTFDRRRRCRGLRFDSRTSFVFSFLSCLVFGVFRRPLLNFHEFISDHPHPQLVQNDGQRSRVQHPRRPQEEDEGDEGGVREVPRRLRGPSPEASSRDRQERGSKDGGIQTQNLGLLGQSQAKSTLSSVMP